MSAVYFDSPDAFRAWLEEHHASEDELWVGYWKVATGKPSLTWSESVDQALCFGWIDGLRHSVDAERYRIRFTPRRPTSHWSRVNLEKYAALAEQGLLAPAGIAAFEARKPDRQGQYSYEQREPEFTAEQLGAIKAEPEAWAFFREQPPGYRRSVKGWVNAAKRESTRARRMASVIADSKVGLRIKQLRR